MADASWRRDVTDAVEKEYVAQAEKSLDEKLTEPERAAFYDHSSERAMAIVLGQIVENRLTDYMRLLMRREKALADELFNPSGPLGPFGTKIRVAYMMRILSEQSYRDLIIVNRIRNKFAHDLSVTSFSDRQITDWVKNMNMYSIIRKMSEEAIALRASDTPLNRSESAAAFVKAQFIATSKDAYRACLRFIIHHLADAANAILAAREAKMNAPTSPEKYDPPSPEDRQSGDHSSPAPSPPPRSSRT
jgi:DNA-binding MltR family transcriptional regulator